jgi:hypothetical protein
MKHQINESFNLLVKLDFITENIHLTFKKISLFLKFIFDINILKKFKNIRLNALPNTF